MEIDFEITDLISGRPNHELSKKVSECYDILDELNIKYECVEYNRPPKIQEELCLVDEKIKVKGIKNLMFKTKNGQNFFFVIIPRGIMFDAKEFRARHNVSKLEMAKNKDLEELLKTFAGAVSVMELINDKNNKIKLFIDEAILKEKYFRFHPNENSATVRISMQDFKEKLIPYIKHDINIL